MSDVEGGSWVRTRRALHTLSLMILDGALEGEKRRATLQRIFDKAEVPCPFTRAEVIAALTPLVMNKRLMKDEVRTARGIIRRGIEDTDYAPQNASIAALASLVVAQKKLGETEVIKREIFERLGSDDTYVPETALLSLALLGAAGRLTDDEIGRLKEEALTATSVFAKTGSGDKTKATASLAALNALYADGRLTENEQERFEEIAVRMNERMGREVRLVSWVTRALCTESDEEREQFAEMVLGDVAEIVVWGFEPFLSDIAAHSVRALIRSGVLNEGQREETIRQLHILTRGNDYADDTHNPVAVIFSHLALREVK